MASTYHAHLKWVRTGAAGHAACHNPRGPGCVTPQCSDGGERGEVEAGCGLKSPPFSPEFEALSLSLFREMEKSTEGSWCIKSFYCRYSSSPLGVE